MEYNNNMDYIALYRKYRPQTFDEVVEQDSVVKILREELKKGKNFACVSFCWTKRLW